MKNPTHTLLALLLAAVATCATGASSAAETNATNTASSAPAATPTRTGYAPLHGLRLYFEIYGPENATTPPLVLLHGGGDTIQTSFGHILPALARNRQIIAFEQQGFGHTADVPYRPFTFEQSADDTAALLNFLHVEKADLFGFSNGGTIALQVAIRHPNLVRKLVLASTLFKRAGSYPQFWTSFATAKLSDMPKELRDAYLAVAPHPENLQSFFDKCVQRMRDFKDIPDETIHGIAAPTLVLCGDSDVVRPEHAVETFRLLSPHAQMAILPDTDHLKIMARAEWLVPMINAFLDAPMAP